MPIYEYRCENGHSFEALQKMADDPLTACEVCGAPVERVFHPVAVHFKGSGFYTTDYGSQAKAGANSSGEGEGSDSSGSGEAKESTKSKESKESKKDSKGSTKEKAAQSKSD